MKECKHKWIFDYTVTRCYPNHDDINQYHCENCLERRNLKEEKR